MTRTFQGEEKGGYISYIRAVSLLMLAVLIGIVLPKTMGEFVREGLELAVRCVLPSAFPFMIFSDIYVHFGSAERLGISWALSHIFGIPRAAVGSVIVGCICGFPMGARITAELYLSGEINRSDAERMLALSSLPSCAFIAGAVGVGMYGDMRIGLLLILSLFASAVICGFITREARGKSEFASENARQKYDFVSSVKGAGASSIAMIAFITVFSVLVGFLKKYIKTSFILYLLCSILEVTNAVKMFSELHLIHPIFSISMCAFSLGFGGLSVMLQSMVFTEKTDLKYRKYIGIKLLEGLVSAALASLSYTIIFI